MYAVLSPAKKLIVPSRDIALTTPVFSEETTGLATILKGKTPADLGQLMSLSENLSQLNFERFQVFEGPGEGNDGHAAALTFAGDTYQGFDAGSLSDEDLTFAQAHVGILSGLYGLLRPLDSIEPYRLEMGTKLETPKGVGLYRYWGHTITQEIERRVAGHKDQTVINLASKEYFSAVAAKSLSVPVVTPVFKEIRDGKAKVISFLAKKARGRMARFMVTERVQAAEGLKAFRADGYAYDAALSDEANWVFTRAN
ncbi:MAG: peroxide stress protein YaaA [Bradymonadia bacterium]